MRALPRVLAENSPIGVKICYLTEMGSFFAENMRFGNKDRLVFSFLTCVLRFSGLWFRQGCDFACGKRVSRGGQKYAEFLKASFSAYCVLRFVEKPAVVGARHEVYCCN